MATHTIPHSNRTLDVEANVGSCGLNSNVQAIFDCIKLFYNDNSNLIPVTVAKLLEEAEKTCDQIFGKREAIKWGSNFEWPQEVFTRDAQLAASYNYNLSDMTVAHHRSRSSNRLSKERIEKIVNPSDPDYNILIDLSSGMRVFHSPTFCCNNCPPPMRKLYQEVACAVNKILLDSWRDGLVFIFPKSIINKFGDIHYSPVHWTTKVGKESGRNLFDSSDDKHGEPLNSEDARVMLEQYYGKIEHPTISDISNLIMRYYDNFTQKGLPYPTDVILWKADLKGAFTLLNFRPSDVKFLACQLTDDLVLMYHTGLFGWTGTPYAFQVITRVIKRLLRQHISEYIEMYVDDMIGICRESEFESIKAKVISICEGLLGPNSVAYDKWAHGRKLDVLGWHINLDLMQVSIARRNFLKIVYGFFQPHITKRVTVPELERLASWSARYTTILRHATPLTTILYHEFSGLRNQHLTKTPSTLFTCTVILWRCLLCLLNFDDKSYSRSLDSFISQKPNYRISFDASLKGIGVGITDITSGELISIASYEFPFDLHEQSKYQNTVEFIAVVIGIWILTRHDVRDCHLELVGDSITALTWSYDERFKGLFNLGPAVAFTMLGTYYNIWVASIIHVAGENNQLYDSLSRGKNAAELNFDPKIIYDLSSDVKFQQLISYCNPSNSVSNGNYLLSMWNSVHQLVMPQDR